MSHLRRLLRSRLSLCVALIALSAASGCVSVFSADEAGFVEGAEDTAPADAQGDSATAPTDTQDPPDSNPTDTQDPPDSTPTDTQDPPDSTPTDAQDVPDGDTSSDACEDNTLNGDETDLDCGGSCSPCANYRRCQAGSDCVNKVCTPADDDNICSPPTCTDGAANGTETDLDCGGPNCNACADGLICTQNTDCDSGFCYQGVCTAPTCTDSLRNGAETDIDCGGGDQTCPRCDTSQRCTEGSDCLSDVCNDQGRCDEPSCADGVRNGDEVDIDCGAVSGCGLCADTLACADSSDCASGVCGVSTGTCQTPTCTDATLNGAETDTDCGGSCPRCTDGQTCRADNDCQSSICAQSGVCVGAGCVDGVQNGGESGPDCGGPCAPCGLGVGCVVNSDCISNKCGTNSTCVAPVCGDGVVGPGEACDDGNTNNLDACVNCQAATCGDSFVRAGVEECDDGNTSNTDACTTACLNARCGDRFVRAGVEQCDDGNTSNADLCTNTCTLTTCTDGARNADETDIDCGGRCGPTCALAQACADDSDCAQGRCLDGVCTFAPSCRVLLERGATESRVYTLDPDGPFGSKPPFQAYCDQTTEGGGWTLAMKVGGNESNWRYGSSSWTNTSTLNETSPDLSRQDAKLRSALEMPFEEVMVRFEAPKSTDPTAPIETPPFVIRAAAGSLAQLFASNQRVSFTIGREQWQAAAPRSLLPSTPQCDQEGLNLETNGRIRIGLISTRRADCASGSSGDISWIGLGWDGASCNGGPAQNPGVGASGCADDGTRATDFGFGAIFIR